MPPNLGRKRCKGIRVMLKTVIRLDLGPGRMGEEDTLFERKVEVIGGTAEGCGSKRARRGEYLQCYTTDFSDSISL